MSSRITTLAGVLLIAFSIVVIVFWDDVYHGGSEASDSGRNGGREDSGGSHSAHHVKNVRSATRTRAARRNKLPKIRTESGLVYQQLRAGTGPTPNPEDKVEVIYRGYLPDGTEFDRSPLGKPVQFPLSAVIKGWQEGLQLMRVGSIYRFVIPPDLAYGDRGAGEKIQPDQTLVFEVELVAIHGPPIEK